MDLLSRLFRSWLSACEGRGILDHCLCHCGLSLNDSICAKVLSVQVGLGVQAFSIIAIGKPV